MSDPGTATPRDLDRFEQNVLLPVSQLQTGQDLPLQEPAGQRGLVLLGSRLGEVVLRERPGRAERLSVSHRHGVRNQHVHEPHQVAVHVRVRVLQRVAHAGLRGQVHHHLGPLVGEQARHPVAVRQLHPLEAEAVAPLQPRQPRLLEARVVVGVHVVDPQHLVAARQQAFGEVVADEAGGAGDEIAGHVGWHG